MKLYKYLVIHRSYLTVNILFGSKVNQQRHYLNVSALRCDEEWSIATLGNGSESCWRSRHQELSNKLGVPPLAGRINALIGELHLIGG